MSVRLTTHQIGLLLRQDARMRGWGRKTKRFCNTCGGTHAGPCVLVSTTHGTRCRPAILDVIERRFRERQEARP